MKTAMKLGAALLCLLFVSLFFLPPAEKSNSSDKQRSSDGSRSFAGSSVANDEPKPVTDGVWVGEAVIPTIGPPIGELPLYVPEITLDREINPRLDLSGKTDEDVPYPGGILGGVDPLLAQQEGAPPATAEAFLTPILNFAGGGYTGVNPPDTVGDVGPNHYVQIINSGSGGVMRIYDKSGTLLAGPTALDGFGSGACSNGYGDGIVLYDQLADRWMLSEFAGSGNHLCVYISTGADPVSSSWYAYDFATPDFPDYPKYAVWPDAYYVGSNENSSATYALDRSRMLNGQTATAQRFATGGLAGFGFQMLIPSDLDGATAPPAGAPNYFMRHRDDEVHNPGSNDPTQDFLEIYSFHVDFATPGNSTFTGPINVPVAEFDSHLCGYFSFYCIGMPGVPTGSSGALDPLREVVMFRLVYRNFGTHETLLGNLVTDVDNSDHAGVRWFELRKSGANAWTLYQEGTYAPDGDSRWMGAIGMDGSGNIAVGYNVSGSSTYPSLRYTGRLASDPLGTLPQGEGTLINGSGSNGSNRYGDYSALSIDPADECTFWFTGEYNASSNWSTRIGSFKFDACGEPDFVISVDPQSEAICAGSDALFTVNIGQVEGYSDAVTLSSSGEPAGTTVGFNPNPVTPPGSSTMSIGTTGGAAAGSYSIEVSGSSTTGTKSQTVDLNLYDAAPADPTLLTPADNSSDVSFYPTFSWTAAMQAVSYELEVATDAGFGNVVYSAVESGTSHTITVPLNKDSIYYWRVTTQNPCGTESSTAFSFTTQAATMVCNGAAAVFEEGIPGDWTVVDSTGGSGIVWTTTTDSACRISNRTNGSGEAACADSDAAGSSAPAYDTALVSNSFDLSTSSAASLDVKGYYRDLDSNTNDRFEVDVWNGSSWTNELSWDEDHEPEDFTLDLAAYAGLPEVQVRFRFFGDGWDWYAQVDDVALTCTPDAGLSQVIDLDAGWNMISSYRSPDPAAMAQIFAAAGGDIVLCKDGAGLIFWPDMGIDQIGDWGAMQGYQCYANNDFSIAISGSVIPAGSPLTVLQGWNMIAYWRDIPLTAESALASCSGELALAKNGVGEVYWPAFSVNQMGNMQPGEGYLLFADPMCTLIYPESN